LVTDSDKLVDGYRIKILDAARKYERGIETTGAQRYGMTPLAIESSASVADVNAVLEISVSKALRDHPE
jgi:hypothetical protein